MIRLSPIRIWRSPLKMRTRWRAISPATPDLLVGISAAAAVVGCLKIARDLQLRGNQEAVIVTILCDSGDKYLSERFWTEG